MSTVDVFVSFDVEHDTDLYELLLEQSRAPGSGFTICDCSELSTAACLDTESLRRRIREVDQVILICGEHTEESASVSAELAIAQEEETHYFLLWGRRESMCTKPRGAKTAEGMYGWTRQVLRDQMAVKSRKEAADAAAAAVRHAHPKR